MPKFTYKNAENHFSKVPDGEYLFRVVEAVNGISQKSGNETIEMQLEVASGEQKGGRVYDTLTFSEKASWRIDTFLKSAGAAPDKDQVEMELDADDCLGATVYARVEEQPARDGYKARVRIAEYLPKPERKPEVATLATPAKKSIIPKSDNLPF